MDRKKKFSPRQAKELITCQIALLSIVLQPFIIITCSLIPQPTVPSFLMVCYIFKNVLYSAFMFVYLSMLSVFGVQCDREVLPRALVCG